MINNPTRTVQHKQQREDRRSQEVQTLKSENRTLRKQLTRLRKELQKSEPEMASEADDYSEPTETSKPKCIKCNSGHFKSMVMPTGTKLTVCQDCGNRSKD